jgi:hypothetical protein
MLQARFDALRQKAEQDAMDELRAEEEQQQLQRREGEPRGGRPTDAEAAPLEQLYRHAVRRTQQQRVCARACVCVQVACGWRILARSGSVSCAWCARACPA